VYRRYTIRPDGFVSIHAPLAGGALLTPVFTFTGSRLELNFSASAAGSLRVEFQEPDGRPVSGFTMDDAWETLGDALDRTVLWKGGPDVGALAGRPVRLKIVLRDADLFSLRFGA